MRYAVLQEGEDLSALTRRVFRSRSRLAMDDAEQRILKANPRLAKAEGLKPGTLVVVPEVTGVTATEEAVGGAEVATQLLGALREMLGDLGQAITANLDQQEEEAKSTVSLLRSAKLTRLAEKHPALKERLPEAVKTAQGQLNQVKALRAQQKDALAEFEKDFEELRKRFG
ncbi:MAG: hypothetical protein FJW34_22040 [Acidobacteria bacterium]|nr:hypothetical protein [Acidobacteriota bacterium]